MLVRNWTSEVAGLRTALVDPIIESGFLLEFFETERSSLSQDFGLSSICLIKKGFVS